MNSIPNTPQLNSLSVNFAVEKMLGRPIKKYNLIIMTDEGNSFSSSDNRVELVQYLKKCEDRDSHNCNGWALWYLLQSITTPEDMKFYMIASLRDFDKVVQGRRCKLDKYEYVSVKLGQ
tara:strand:- start:813 stop:1169 length:357 start_codon:yes stop_codon:yes gene_type:complete